MSNFWEDDAPLFFEDFGESAIVNNETIVVIFDRKNQEENYPVAGMGFNGFSGEVSKVSLLNEDIKRLDIKKNTIIKVRDIDFLVKELQFDLSGVSVLMLEMIQE